MPRGEEYEWGRVTSLMTPLLRRIALKQPIREVERHPGDEISLFAMQDSQVQQPDKNSLLKESVARDSSP